MSRNASDELDIDRSARLRGVPRIWLGSDSDTNSTRLFRKAFIVRDADGLQSAELAIFADAVYHLWANGRYLGRGPTYFHPHRRPVQFYDVLPWLRSGRNVLAALAHSPGISLHNYTASSCPGLVVRLDMHFKNNRKRVIISDSSWRATDQTGWLSGTPRRSWALGFIEHFDAGRCPAGWNHTDYDDRRWSASAEHPAFRRGYHGVYIDPQLPGLRFKFASAGRLTGIFAVDGAGGRFQLSPRLSSAAFGEVLMAERWMRRKAAVIAGKYDPATGGFIMSGLTASDQIALCFDLGAQYSGGVVFEMEADSAGTIDIGWAELMQNGRPQILRKGNTYADRYEAVQGTNNWQPVGFSSGRYLCLILRGFAGKARFRKFGMLTSEPALTWNGVFRCENKRLNGIWNLCARTLRVGTQEGLMDCPTREQATYIVDGNLAASWIGRLTGNYAYWRHLIRETFAVQGASGLVKTCVFSGQANLLLDLELLAVVFARDYLLETGDLALIRRILPACRRLVDGFGRWQNDEGMFAFDWERQYKARRSRHKYCAKVRWVANPGTALAALDRPAFNVFIDHPGMGWHNVGEPGMDRRGLNAAMNALLAIACRALGEMLAIRGDNAGAGRYRVKADVLAEQCRRFFNARRGVFVDGIRRGKKLRQISQQTNTWCLLARVLDESRGKPVMRRILNEHDRDIARSGPAFWSFMLPLMHSYGMHRRAMRHVERLWSGMIDAGATALWETFAGDAMDSYCHPWSGAPLDFMLRHVAGIGPIPANREVVELRPRTDLLKHVSAGVMTGRGKVTIAWARINHALEIWGNLPAGMAASISLPTGATIKRRGAWRVCIKGKNA